jgi:hypothetical protein
MEVLSNLAIHTASFWSVCELSSWVGDNDLTLHLYLP